MHTKRVFWILLLTTLLVFAYALYHFFHTEERVEKEITQYEDKTLSPQIYLGYVRGKFYTPEISLKPDLALLYKFTKPLQLNQVGIKGVWFIERDRISSLSDNAILSVNFKGVRIFVEMSGYSNLPVRIEIDGRPSGEIYVDGSQSYEIYQGTADYKARLLTLYIPRGIAVYSLNFTD